MAGLFGKVNRNKWNHWSVYYLPVWHVIIGYATCLCQGIIPFQDTLSLALWHNLNPIIPHASSSDYKAANDLLFCSRRVQATEEQTTNRGFRKWQVKWRYPSCTFWSQFYFFVKLYLPAERTDDLGRGGRGTVLARSGEKVLQQSLSINSTHLRLS